MIIIIDKQEVTGNRVSVAHIAPLAELDIMDISSQHQLTLNAITMANLLVVTDAETKEYIVLKDRYSYNDDASPFKTGMVYKSSTLAPKLEQWLSIRHQWMEREEYND